MPGGIKIVAELSCNHQGTLERALDLVHAAAAAGADAIKLQTWAPGKMVLDPSLVIQSGPWAGRNIAQLYAEAHTPWDWHRPIFDAAAAHKMEAFSSVFDHDSLEFLEGMRCPRYKISSFELVDLPLIQAVAATKKPIILSTGMAMRAEIVEAIDAAGRGGARDITVLKCTSAYPADPASANLATMGDRFSLTTHAGLSDHTKGIGVALVAAALGAVMIEKHFTLSRAAGGLDAEFSIEPDELASLVREIPNVIKCIGRQSYGHTPMEKPQLELRRSLYFTQDARAGTYLSEQHIATARPALGLMPRFYKRVLGKQLAMDVKAGEPVSWGAMRKDEIA